MQLEEVFENVKNVIEKSIGKPEHPIELDQTLFDELGID